MPLTSRPGEMSGNIPLILLASQDDGTSYYHPLARQGYTADLAQPCIISSDLGASNAPCRFSVWLPTPTLVGCAQRRRLLIAYEVRLNQADQNGNKLVAMPQFQPRVLSTPSRSTSSSVTSYTTVGPSSQTLCALTAAGDVRHGEAVIEITNISAPGDVSVDADALCFLEVQMPYDKNGNVTSLVFRLLGIAVDQW